MAVAELDREELLDQAIAEFLEAADDGEPLDPETLLDKYPTIRRELSAFFKARAGVAAKMGCFQPPAARSVADPQLTGGFVPAGHASPDWPDIPGLQILEVLGRGGMGVVYKARQIKANRLVALKMILGQAADPTALERFRVEAEVIAGADHPNIVKVFEVGEHDGQPYFALEYCPNGSLAEKLKANPLPPAEAARLVAKLAGAMSAAHAKQVIHRDLKPANVLIGNDGEPKITDFGLAKRLDDDSGQTHTNAVMGTPTYMAPEQAFGDTKNASPAMDVYSLGVILYECLTGTVPFRGATIPDTLDQVRNRDPIPVRQLQPGVARDLETITLRCLQKSPAKRYATAGELADDLRRWLENKPVVARPVGRAERCWKWMRRNPSVTGFMVALAFGIAGTAGFAWKASVSERNATASAAQSARDEKKATEQTLVAKNTLTKSLQSMRLALEQLNGESLKNAPGTQELRATLALQLADGAEELVAIWPEDDNLREFAGTVWQLNGEAAIGLKSEQDAADLFHRAEVFQRKRLEENPGDIDGRMALGKTLCHIASRLQRTGKLREAMTASDEARQIQSQLLKEPAVQQQPGLLGRCHFDLAMSCLDAGILSGRFDEAGKALTFYRLSASHMNTATESLPQKGKEAALVESLLICVLIAHHHRSERRVEEAEKIIAEGDRLVREFPAETRFQPHSLLRLGSFYQTKYLVLAQAGKRPEAFLALTEAISLREKAILLNPQVPSFRADCGSSHAAMARFLLGELNEAGALEHQRKACEYYSLAVAVVRDISEYNENLLENHIRLSNMCRKQERWQEAVNAIGDYAKSIRGDKSKLYFVGREYAIIARAIDQTKPADKGVRDIRDAAAESAVLNLLDACRGGFADHALLKKEVPLQLLKKAPRAKQLFDLVSFTPETAND